MQPWPLLLLPVLALAAAAQSSGTPRSATGTVTGHVSCADTNAPARMAKVQLESIKDPEQRATGHRSSSGGPTGGIVQTTLDGSFLIPNVPPGSYYVVASAAGYLSTRASAEDSDQATPPAPSGQPPVVIPRVNVEADQTAAIDIRLERGAAVSGTIRFDDGSPATGVHVAVVRKSKDKSSQSNSNDIGIQGSEVTDDLGHYRVSGLRDREYVLETLLAHMDLMPGAKQTLVLSEVMRSTLMIYSGDVTRKSDAVSFKLGPGEERTGEDITIPLSKLHSISGVVTAARDGHAINAGNLDIRTPDDNESVANAEIGSDGTFHLESVPEGTYVVRIHNPHDKAEQEMTTSGSNRITFLDEKTVHQYGDLEQSLKIEGDIPNLVLAVPEPKSPATTPSQ